MTPCLALDDPNQVSGLQETARVAVAALHAILPGPSPALCPFLGILSSLLDTTSYLQKKGNPFSPKLLFGILGDLRERS